MKAKYKKNTLESVSKDVTKIKIEEGCESIGPKAFADCDKLEEVIFPSTLKSISFQAFLNCNSLKTICLPNSVKIIKRGAFENSGLIKIKLSDDLETLDTCAFISCNNLEEITVSDKNNFFSTENGILFNKDKTKIVLYPANRKGNFYKIPDSIIVIGENAFGDNNNLEKIKMSDYVIFLESCAFLNSKKLKDINISKNIDYLEMYTFSNCESLEKIVIPENVMFADLDTFIGDKNLKHIYTTPKFKERNEDFFDYYGNICEVIKKITIDDLLDKGKDFRQINKIFKEAKYKENILL